VPDDTYLQMIQTIITRLANQSTTVKGWSITLTAGLLSYAITTTTPLAAALAIYVVAAFATLDAYYLTLERNYRRLYRQATTTPLAERALEPTAATTRHIATALRSPGITLLHGTSLVVTTATTIYLATR